MIRKSLAVTDSLICAGFPGLARYRVALLNKDTGCVTPVSSATFYLQRHATWWIDVWYPAHSKTPVVPAHHQWIVQDRREEQ